MKREDLYFDSRDGKSKIHAVRWEPDDTSNVVAVLQIVHGMAEHVDRYEEFAKFLTDRNFVVTADDHLGHGKTCENAIPGYFCKNDPATTVVKDVHRLKKITQEKYPRIPYYILGHSMGSFILRNYLFQYGKGISGAIIMGTGMVPASMARLSYVMASLGCIFGKSQKPSTTLDKIAFGTYLKRIPNPRTPADWLSKNEANVDEYIKDPLCGFVFTCNGFKTLGSLLCRLVKKSNIEKMPVSLRVFIVSGEEDPVGDYGQGPKKVYKQYIDEGMQKVEMKLYPDDRHEILNELDRATVYEDIYQWIIREV